ncbi:glycosyltransferase family protein [Rhodoferax sp. 4810]|uniref:Glycosyltransferase family protein n=1 Tax=Thiospirillum jenense TaxID=1653858 RepID=A0A839HFM9_9GAMM|nr:glycosyltransferase family protein [Thiospirillum jenense]MBB1073510.1 glycosyltransferase family protein [Rhodoferax jenense]MBB1125998.1 glycosyltransferase family protein [Thiospirillum jenense]
MTFQKIVVITQARMASTRLPGKVMMSILNKPLLMYQIERLKHISNVHAVVVATTTSSLDDVIEDFCHQQNVAVFRGDELDVLKRYYEAAKQFNADIVVRVTSDCPLIDPKISEQVINFYLDSQGKVDYVSNTIERTYPRGLDTEVFSFALLELAYEEATKAYEREHVTPFFYCQPERFRISQIKNAVDLSQYRWTVDTAEDFELVKRVLEKIYPVHSQFAMEDIVRILDQNPEWSNVNSHIMQKALVH